MHPVDRFLSDSCLLVWLSSILGSCQIRGFLAYLDGEKAFLDDTRLGSTRNFIYRTYEKPDESQLPMKMREECNTTIRYSPEITHGDSTYLKITTDVGHGHCFLT